MSEPPSWMTQDMKARIRNRLVTEFLDEAAERTPDKVAVTGRSSMLGLTTTLSFRQLRLLVDRIAAGLAGLGVEQGEVVSCQLPNWWQVVALHLACVRIGAITNPLMPIFRQRELRQMLGFAESKVLVVPRLFRGCDHPALIAEIRPELPALKHVLVIGGDGPDSFERCLVDRRWEDEVDTRALFETRRPAPDDVVQLLYTSGTTGAPKGVLHTSRSLLSSLHEYVARLGLNRDDVLLMSSPMGHQTGFQYGIVLATMLGAKLVLQDVWNGGEALRLIQDERVTWSKGSTPFLTDLADSPVMDRADLRSFRMFVSSGAPIPPALVERATRRLGIAVISGWGMSETGTTTTTVPGDSEDRIFGTDGVALPGMEVRIVDQEGRLVTPGVEGVLQARGIGLFKGYFRHPNPARVFTPEGWFDTGDLARMDATGYIRITGRSKDIIIRGGENVPVVEVEQLLYRHPAVKAAAIVGYPDPRLGERACAFVVLKEGAALDFAGMVAWLEQSQLARQYFPEQLQIMDALPSTLTGKIQKFQLRTMAKDLFAPQGEGAAHATA